MDREDEDFGEGYIAESHPLRPTHLTVPLGGRSDSRAPSISSSVSDLDVPIYSRETTIPLSARKVKRSRRARLRRTKPSMYFSKGKSGEKESVRESSSSSSSPSFSSSCPSSSKRGKRRREQGRRKVDRSSLNIQNRRGTIGSRTTMHDDKYKRSRTYLALRLASRE